MQQQRKEMKILKVSLISHDLIKKAILYQGKMPLKTHLYYNQNQAKIVELALIYPK